MFEKKKKEEKANTSDSTTGNEIKQEVDDGELSKLNQYIAKIIDMLERIRFQEYVEHYNNPKKMLGRSFISGVSRGFGMAIGFTVLGAILIQVLTALANNNIPIISKYIANIIKTVEQYL